MDTRVLAGGKEDFEKFVETLMKTFHERTGAEFNGKKDWNRLKVKEDKESTTRITFLDDLPLVVDEEIFLDRDREERSIYPVDADYEVKWDLEDFISNL